MTSDAELHASAVAGNLDNLPGGEMVRRGLADIVAGSLTEESLLILIGAPRLRRLGFVLPESEVADPEAELYARLSGDS